MIPSVVLLIGRRGSGKSTLAKRLIGDRRRVIAIDPTGEYSKLRGWRRARHFGELTNMLAKGWSRGFRIGYRPPPEREIEALHHVANYIGLWQSLYFTDREPVAEFFTARPDLQVTLLVEEMNLSYPAEGVGKFSGFTRALLQGRHAGISIVGITQRPTLVRSSFRDQAAEVYAFPLGDDTSRRWLIDKTGKEYAAEVRILRDHHYFLVRNGQVTRGKNPPLRKKIT